jgi:hypothetical protein
MAKKNADNIISEIEAHLKEVQEAKEEYEEAQEAVIEAEKHLQSVVGKIGSTKKVSRSKPRIKNKETLGLTLAGLHLSNGNKFLTVQDAITLAKKSGWRTASSKPWQVVYQTYRSDEDFVQHPQKAEFKLSAKALRALEKEQETVPAE